MQNIFRGYPLEYSRVLKMKLIPVLFTLVLLAMLVLAGTASADKDSLVWYGKVEVSEGDVVELAQSYSLHITQLAGARDGAMFELHLNDSSADGIATSTSPYTYTVSRNDTEYTILEIEGYEPKSESGRAGLRIYQYSDPGREDTDAPSSSTLSLKVGKKQELEEGYSLLASEYDSEEEKATIEVYSGTTRVGTYVLSGGEHFGYVVRHDSVHRCILFGTFSSAAQFNESEPYILILKHVLQYSDPSWTATPTATATSQQTPAPEPLEVEVEVLSLEGSEHIAAGTDAYVKVRVLEPLSFLGIYLDGALVDSRENCSAPVYTAQMLELSEGAHTLTVKANATSGKWAVEQREFTVGKALSGSSASSRDESAGEVKPPKVPAFSAFSALCMMLLLWMMRRKI